MFVNSKVGRRRENSRRLLFESLERREVLSAVPPTVVNVEVASTQWTSAFIEYLQENSLGENGYSIPVGSTDQSCSLTWTGINQIIITFSEDVYVDREDLSLSGVNTTAYRFSNFEYDPQTHVAIWTLTFPAFIDRLQIDLDGDGADPVRNLDGVALDGYWVNEQSTYGSGSGVPGTDFEFTFNVLPADIDNTGNITYFDYYSIYQSRGLDVDDAQYLVFLDVDGDGEIDSVDWQLPVILNGQGLPTGLPAGTFNDAPTVSGLDLEQISINAQDQAISLLYGFDDAEDGAQGLYYSVTGVSNSTLLKNIAVDQVTKELTFDTIPGQSGRTNLTIRATDTGGLFVETTLTIDVGYENSIPDIRGYAASVGPQTWLVSGQLTDYDDNLDEFIIEFHGLDGIKRVTVQDDGQFECIFITPPEIFAYTVTAVTYDPHGAQSNMILFELGIT